MNACRHFPKRFFHAFYSLFPPVRASFVSIGVCNPSLGFSGRRHLTRHRHLQRFEGFRNDKTMPSSLEPSSSGDGVEGALTTNHLRLFEQTNFGRLTWIALIHCFAESLRNTKVPTSSLHWRFLTRTGWACGPRLGYTALQVCIPCLEGRRIFPQRFAFSPDNFHL